MGKKIIVFLSLAVILAAGCSDEIESPSGVSDLPPMPEIPRGLTASVGEGQVVLEWTVTDPSIESFVVYYSDSAATDMLVFDTASENTTTVSGLVNGRRYYFRVSSIDGNGIEGNQSTPVAGTPGIFSILISDGDEYIKTKSVTIQVTAPAEVSLLQLSEDSTFADAHWDAMGGAKSFELSEGDGLKTVYARFQLDAGGNSVGVVSDDITLDRITMIDSLKIFIDGTVEVVDDITVKVDDTLRFELFVSEPGQLSSVNIAELRDVDLNDYGYNGDHTAGDLIYGGIWLVPLDFDLVDEFMSGRFTDMAGNHAPHLVPDIRLTVSTVPPPVKVWGFALSSLEVQLQWEPTRISDFSRYRIFRSDCPAPPCPDSVLIVQILSATDSKFADGGLDEDKDYHYWIYVDDTHGNAVRSETVTIRTLVNEPPDTMNIIARTTGDTQTARVEWLSASEAEDFQAYLVLRDIAALPEYDPDDYTGYPEDKVIKFINDKATTTYTDSAIPDTGMYYYQVYVIDEQGMVSRSNQEMLHIAE